MVNINNDLHAFDVLNRMWATTQPEHDAQSVRALEHLIELMVQKIDDPIQTDYIRMMVQQSINATKEVYGNSVNKATLNEFVTRNGFYDFRTVGVNAKSISYEDLPQEEQVRFMQAVNDSGYTGAVIESECGIHQYQLMVDDKVLVEIEGLTNDFVPYTNGEDTQYI